jgi:AcrR family transcriptional regulator
MGSKPTPTLAEPQPEYPLREGRKLRTRTALIDAAATLFAEHGYENTSLEAIAERAEVHVQTLYRHFPNKETLAIAGDLELYDRFRAALQERDAKSQPVLEFWKAWATDLTRKVLERSPNLYRERVRMRERVPVFSMMSTALWQNYIDLLSVELAKEMGLSAKKSRLQRTASR